MKRIAGPKLDVFLLLKEEEASENNCYRGDEKTTKN